MRDKSQERNETNAADNDVALPIGSLGASDLETRDTQREIQLSKKLGSIQFSKLSNPKPFCLRSVNSTQDYISKQMPDALEGSFVISEIQTHGRGRESRQWVSDRGGLYVSIRLEPPDHIVDKITAICSDSILSTLRDDYSLKGCMIKSPNDVICNGKKIAGVLVDVNVKGKENIAFVGLGANLNNGSSWKPELLKIATSYKRETNKEIDIDSFLIKLLLHLDDRYASQSAVSHAKRP